MIKLKIWPGESYFNLELELNKNNLKKKLGKYCVKLYINKNNRPTKFVIHIIINGKSNSNISEIVEEFNNFFVNIGEQTAKNLPQPTNSFPDYLNGKYAANLFMFPTCEAEILHTTTNLKASTSECYDNVGPIHCRTLNTEISELEASVYVDRKMSTACRCNAGISLPYAADTSSDVSV